MKLCFLGVMLTTCPEATVEIKIITLDSQTYTLRVDKCVPVLALKEQIATVTGVLSEQQRLICRGKVLKDDHVLSAYHVEDGHTLHLVVRQPLYPSLDSSVDHSANDPVLSSGHRVNQSGSNAAEETFNISEWDDEYPPEVIQVLSRIWSSSEGSDLNEATPEGPFRSTLGGLRYHDGRQTDQTAASGQSNPGIGGTSFFASAPLDRLQLPQVIPDSLATLSQYLDRMRNAFTANVRDSSISSQGGGNIVINGQDDTNARAVSGGLPTPASLADVILSTRQLLMDQSADSLSQLARQLMDQTNVTDPLARMATQSNAIRTGVLLQQLGALLLELGRTTMTLRMGQTPTEALVTAGPAVFISSSGPSPFMVQPLHFQTAESFGEIPTGTGHGGSGLSEGSVGSGFFPRNIDIRISTGSLASSTTPTASQREATGVQQPSRQSNQSSHGRNVVAALPASVVRVSANTIRFSVGLTYPNLARMRRVSGQQPYSSSTVPQAGSGLTRGDANLSAGDGAQNVRGSSLDISSGLDRLLMSVFPGEDIYASGVNTQGMGTTSATSDSRIIQGETATTSQESAPVFEDDDPFSFLLHQFLPRRSQSTAGGSAAGGGEEDVIENRNTQTSSTQDHEIANRGTRSRRHGNPPSSPSSKRLRR